MPYSDRRAYLRPLVELQFRVYAVIERRPEDPIYKFATIRGGFVVVLGNYNEPPNSAVVTTDAEGGVVSIQHGCNTSPREDLDSWRGSGRVVVPPLQP